MRLRRRRDEDVLGAVAAEAAAAAGPADAAGQLADLARTVRAAAEGLCDALVAGTPDEYGTARQWVASMRDRGAAEHWHAPPPDGTTVLSGAAGWPRLDASPTTDQGAWPGPAAKGAGPVGFHTSPLTAGLLPAEFGCTLYRGDDPAVRDHLNRVLWVLAGTVEGTGCGQTLGEVHDRYRALWERAGLAGCGGAVGRTVPWFGSQVPEQAVWDPVAAVAAAQQPVVAGSAVEVTGTCAFTLGAQLGGDGLPTAWFCPTVAFVDGRRHVLAGWSLPAAVWGGSWLEDPWRHEPFSGLA